MKKSLGQKIGIWIILILTSLALVVPSIAIVWNIFQAQNQAQEISITPEDIIITTATPQPELNADENTENNGDVNSESPLPTEENTDS